MLAWLASLAVAGGNIQVAEGYLLELLSWCVYSEREINSNDD